MDTNPSPSRSRSPTRLGDFEVIREVGRGGMGIVYEAKQISLNRRVALKVLSGAVLSSSRAVTRFRREAAAAARLHHTNIVPIYSIGEDDGTHFYAMEYIEGPSLDFVIRQWQVQISVDQSTRAHTPFGSRKSTPSPKTPSSGPDDRIHAADTVAGPSEPLPLTPIIPRVVPGKVFLKPNSFDEIAQLIAGVADGLEHAHRHGIIHRDVKPSNLLLSPEGILSINDFGLARVLEEPSVTLSGEFLGSPLYASPEQINGNPDQLDHRTDVYSLGATLYELLTLRPPFPGEGREQVLAQVLRNEPTPLRKINSKVPLDLETICLKAIEKDPNRRYQHARDLAEDLRRYVNRYAISARRTHPLQRLVKWSKRHPAIAASACLLLLSGIIAFVGVRQHRLLNEQRLAEKRVLEQRLLKETEERALIYTLSGDLGSAEALLPDAERLGASPAWLALRRGQIAYQRGDYDRALQLLQESATKSPSGPDLSTRGLLSATYAATYEWELSKKLAEEVMKEQPSTAEEFLFKGLAESLYDPVQGLKDLDEAVLRRDSVMARVVRAETKARYAIIRTDLKKAEEAVKDATVAEGMWPGNPNALAARLFTCLCAATLFQIEQQPQKRAAVLEQAEADAKALEAFPGLSLGLWPRAMFYRTTGQEEKALKLLRREGANLRDFRIRSVYVELLVWNREFPTALAALESFYPPARLQNRELMRALILAMMPERHADALTAFNDLTTHWGQGDLPAWRQTILLLMGRNQQAVEDSARVLQNPESLPGLSREWYLQLLTYFADRITAEQLLAAAGKSQLRICDAEFFIGLKELARGNREKARQHLSNAVNSGVFFLFAHQMSHGILAQLNHDPTWPSWIPANPQP